MTLHLKIEFDQDRNRWLWRIIRDDDLQVVAESVTPYRTRLDSTYAGEAALARLSQAKRLKVACWRAETTG